MKNAEVSRIFGNIATILEILGENSFRIRAYERAAQTIGGLSEDIEEIAQNERLSEIPGIGHDLSGLIKEYLKTDKIKLYDELKKKVPEGLLTLLDIPSVGPKTAKLLYEKFKIKNIPVLEKAIKQGKLKQAFGFKDKTIANIQKGIEIFKKSRAVMTLAGAELLARVFIAPLKKERAVKKIIAAGSLRRCKETVRDIDILAVSSKPAEVMEAFCSLPEVADITAKGATKASVRAKDGTQIDCRVVEQKSFGASLVYFTGSKDFNIKLRGLAIKKGLKINEYGVFRKDKYISGATEEEVFAALGLPFIEPELRENTGEIELACKSKLPRLLQLKDIKGDLHTHSTWTDGDNTIAEMAEAAKSLGYSYIAVTDHSQSLKVAGGLSVAKLKKKKEEIEKLNARLKGIRVLYGTETEIDSQGKLDYEDGVLKEFDIVVAAVHSGFKQSRQQLTGRITSACKNKYVQIIAHPTGRLWGTREAYDIDMDEIFRAARDTNTALEINSFPKRLDLNDANCRRAVERGVKLAVNTDSHSVEQLSAMRYGVGMARRGWVGAASVINTLPLSQLLKAIRK
ncbi:MAG: DNA polymerase/3'-5' exonuclease PolX [Candidatus Omnitrophota bacterium]|nr:DNA polymerase/3'-5' exonuclease PolX [Candidatus Omnitrophota bacterium]